MTSSGYISSSDSLNLPLPNLPGNYVGPRAQTWLPRPPSASRGDFPAHSKSSPGIYHELTDGEERGVVQRCLTMFFFLVCLFILVRCGCCSFHNNQRGCNWRGLRRLVDQPCGESVQINWEPLGHVVLCASGAWNRTNSPASSVITSEHVMNSHEQRSREEIPLNLQAPASL